MEASARRIALVGSWDNAIEGQRTMAIELASVWAPSDRISVFSDATTTTQELLAARGAPCWPEGAFGTHFLASEYDHVALMIGSRFDSLLTLGRAADSGCHVWLQDEVIDVTGSPIDAPADWLSDVIASARSVIVGSDWMAGTVRRLSPDGPPVLVLPPGHPMVEPIVDPPGSEIVFVGDDVVHDRLVDAFLRDADITVARLDDVEMTSSNHEERLMSARAAIEIRSSQRGFTSMTVTHMMARGVPTITNLTAHAPFADEDLVASGLVVVENDQHLIDRVVALVTPILVDDRAWLAASAAAKTTAARWTWADAAEVLSQWFNTVDELEPSSVRIVGAVAS